MRKILLLDADSLIYICSVKETLVDCIAEFDYRFNKIIEYTKATEYIGFITLNGCFRYKVSSTYKAKRKFSIPPKWLKSLKEYAITQYGFIGQQGLEADDLVGLSKTYFNHLKIDSVIGAIDKDVLKQIPGTHFNYRFDKDTENFIGEVITSPEESYRFLFLQSIMGDSTDGIEGIKGIGEVKANKYLDECNCLSVKDYYSNVIEFYKTHYKSSFLALKKFTETFRLVYILRTNDDYHYELDDVIQELNYIDYLTVIPVKEENW